MYPLELVKPMMEDLTDYGFVELKNESQVIDFVENMKGTAVLVVNSVCGCAAGNARPGVKLSIQGDQPKPDHLVTVFAGVDKEATSKAREYLLPYPPSSPCIALFKEGKLVHMVERHQIEGHTAFMIADNLKDAYSRYC